MTSITLISPINKASNFNVRFRDPIEIKKNSKVYLNYASFTRLNNARFSGNPSLNLKSSFIIPTHQLNDTTILNDLDLTASVDAFSIDDNDFILSPQQIETRLNTSLKSLCIEKLKDYITFEEELVTEDAKTFKLGLVYENHGDVEYVKSIDSTNGYGQGTGGDARTKTSASAAAPFYDNYSIITDSIFIFQQASSNVNFSDELKRFTFTTNKDLDDITGKISIGLFSNDMMDRTDGFDGWINKTRGGAIHNNNYSNPAIFRTGNSTQIKIDDADFDTVKGAGILGSFLTLEIDGTNLNIYQPVNAGGQLPAEWSNINQNIHAMNNIEIIDLNGTNLTLTQAITTTVIFYMDINENEHKKESFKVNFKIFMKNRTDEDEDYEEVYNSKNRDLYYPLSFFNGLDVNEVGLSLLERKARIKAQSPFGLMFSATEQGEGIIMSYTPYTMDILGNPTSILLDYNLNFSEELGEVLDTNKTIDLYPNTYSQFTTSLRVFSYNDFRALLNGLSYDIFLNNLPIKNYKNKEKNNDGGFIKQIVGTCPLPFNEKNTTSINRGRIIGLYEPNNPVKLSLKNQAITLNNLDVAIKTSHDEKPAFELEKVMINIVIEE
tara:strand:+ start:1205 stop:3025 length:1821 start_codon:yes stop_codon:yes gene_type:complete